MDSEDVHEILKAAKVPGASRFSFAADRAIQVLSRYQLENPSSYILKLIQWAVACRPGRVDVEVSHESISVAHDGEATPAGFMDDLLLSDQVPLAHRHLAVALIAAGKLFGKSFRCDFKASDEVPHRVTIHGQRRAGSAPDLWTCIELVGRVELRSFRRLLGAMSALLRPEVPLIRFRCVYAPVPLFLNGCPINQPYFGCHAEYYVRDGVLDVISLPERGYGSAGYIMSERLSSSSLPAPAGNLPGTYFDSNGCVARNGSCFPRLRGLSMKGRTTRACLAMALSAPVALAWPVSELSWVLDGVTVETSPAALGVSSGKVCDRKLVISADGLPCDGTQFHLVRGEAYQQRLDLALGVLEQVLTGTQPGNATRAFPG